MGKRSRLSRGCGWSVRCAIATLAFALCTSAFAGDGQNNVVLPTQHAVPAKPKKICLVVEAGSRIPQPCDRLSAIPTTAHAMDIYGRRPGR
jgi:hypothetical protein